MKFVAKATHVWLAQLDRASGYGPEGREFESSTARKPFRIKVLEGFYFAKNWLRLVKVMR